MTWAERTLIPFPFFVAAILNLFVAIARPLHWRSEHVAGYCFLFATPWAWLIDHDWFGRINARWLEAVTEYLLILWIPALLYSGSLWLLFYALRLRGGHRVNE